MKITILNFPQLKLALKILKQDMEQCIDIKNLLV